METDYARTRISPPVAPRVDVRVVLFTVGEGRLWVALAHGGASYSLPQGDPWPEEPLDGTATRVLSDELGIKERYLEQLYSVSQVSPGDWSVTVAYLGLALTGGRRSAPILASWFDVTDLPPMNPLDRRIVDYAVLRLRAKLGYTTIAFHLLPREFSLSELQQVYEAVLNRRLDKRNFRRRIQSAGFLEATGESRREGSHRPARLFRFRAAHDVEAYLTPAWASSLEGEQTTS
jgi:8-oxo-dGTP diphosphatase